LSSALEPLATFVVEKLWKGGGGLTAAVVDVHHDGRKEVLTLADTLQVLEFTDRRP
jgi:hypothetical protein